MRANIKDFQIVEGTSHGININCVDTDKKNFILDDYKVVFAIEQDGKVVYKESVIDGNSIYIKINPRDTLGKTDQKMNYECRIFNHNDEPLHVVFGKIEVIKANIPIISYKDINQS